MTAGELEKKLEGSCMARLKWLVLKEFCVLPGSKRAGELTDMDYIRCAAQMVLDRRERLAALPGERGFNEGFDAGRFEALGGDGK